MPTRGMSPSTKALLLCQQRSPFQEWVLLRGQPLHSLPDRNLEAVLPSRRRLRLRVLALRPQEPPDLFLHLSSASAVMDVHAYLSKEDLQELMERALDYRRRNGHQKVLLPHFFRNKPRHYFNNIFLTRGGLMEIYRKDANGDQDSAINNGNLFGLFFSASLDLYTHQPPTRSYFGDVRLLVAAPILFRKNSRLYFADFYCNNKAHYITLVLTKQGSEADQFCQNRLIELDPLDNPFLTREPAVPVLRRPTTSMTHRGHYQYQSSMYDDPLSDLAGCFERQLTLNYPHTSAGFYDFEGHQAASYRPFSQRTYSSMHHPAAKVYTTLSRSLHIEVLYTEHVHMTKLQAKYGTENVSWGPCPTLGRGSSLPNGIPKNSACTLCNLPRVD